MVRKRPVQGGRPPTDSSGLTPSSYGRAKYIPRVYLSAAELLEVAADATTKQIEIAYGAKLQEWSGYETVAAVVFEMASPLECESTYEPADVLSRSARPDD